MKTQGKGDVTYSFAVKMGVLRLFLSIALAVLGLAWLPPGTALGAESSMREAFTLGLEIRDTNAERPVIGIHGSRSSPGNSGPFKANIHVYRIPCPGEYFVSGGQENTRNGNSFDYFGVLRLFDLELRPALARCGTSVPPRAGSADVFFGSPERTIFDLEDADRSNRGTFNGDLVFKVFPPCGSYQLKILLNLAGWRRSVDFKAQVIEFEATYQGRKVPKQRC